MTVAALTKQSYLPEAPPLFTRVKEIATVVAQLAVRFLFVVGMILATASAFPLYLHAWVIPAVALGATTLAAFFFPRPAQLDLIAQNQEGHLFIQTRNVTPALAEGFGPEAPRGLRNGLNNCAFNSDVQCLRVVRQIAQWACTLTKEIDINGFERFFADYETPEGIVAAFRTFVDQQPDPRPALRDLFQDFLEEPIWNDSFLLKDTFRALLPLQCAMADFFTAYDDAVRRNLQVSDVSTQGIRAALHQITQGTIPITPQFVDAAEILDAIFSHLPPRMMMKMSETKRYDVRGLPPIKDNPTGVIQIQDRRTVLQLALPRGEISPHLQKMLKSYLNSVTELSKKNIHGGDTVYPVTIVTEFLEFPSSLWIQLKRFDHDVARPSLLTKIASWIWPEIGERPVKLHTPVQIPEELSITLPSGEERTYRLACFINHWGEYGDGHYTADCTINDQKYHMDDSQVTVPDQEQRQQNLQKAYLLCYVPVQAQ